MHPIRTRLVHAAGVLLGAGLAVFLLGAARPSADFTDLPARASVTVSPTGELALTPAPPRAVLAPRAIVPGAAPVRADAVVRNQTGRTLVVGFRATAPARDLDGLLRVRVSADGQTLADTTLQGLRVDTQATTTLPRGARRSVGIELWIPGSITTGYQGRTAAIALVPVIRIVG